MGKQVFQGRYTTEAAGEEGFVVFLIGMRINKWRAVHQWLPVLRAMPPMVKELYTYKDKGFLEMENFFTGRTVLLLQYWKSEEALLTYARGEKHRKAWKKFYQLAGDTEEVGIYHETYLQKPGQYESIYGNMPKFGLAKAIGHTKINPQTVSARRRLKRHDAAKG
ncbi:DUF4188 domain-containing protein [Halobacillus litoralis]|uniref:DUF4188 domain-containing protein n=1 Tax=Halobacillus litoralis TaxID=45668 RepID=UPI001CD23F60|nr:DUF4188 domain-containing protein [Halobacillus litoralis]MCA1023574.1 DUF4188 domain-containing protein [Halobacillus litoralis]